MKKDFALAITSLKKGYAVSVIASGEFIGADSFKTIHKRYQNAGETLCIAFFGDENAEEILSDLVYDELNDDHIVDDIYAVDEGALFAFVELVVTDSSLQVVHMSGSLLDIFRSQYKEAFHIATSDIRNADIKADAEIRNRYFPHITNAREWFVNATNVVWLRQLITAVYFMDRQSAFSMFSVEYQRAKEQLNKLKALEPGFICPKELNPYVVAIAAFGYQSVRGLLYVAAYSLIWSEKDKTQRQNWSDSDRGIFAALRVDGGAVEAMAFTYGWPPHSQRHQLLLIPFDNVIPGGLRFYSNVGIESYLAERHPNITYKEVEIREQTIEQIREFRRIKLKYGCRQSGNWDMVKDYMSI